ncbi:MAG: hypothetical protein QXX17_01275 [Conexivisphaerales archaeon]
MGVLIDSYFTLNATYLITGVINSTEGVSVIIMPQSVYPFFKASGGTPNYYTWYSGQVKDVKIDVVLPAGRYVWFLINLGDVPTNYTERYIEATLLSSQS